MPLASHSLNGKEKDPQEAEASPESVLGPSLPHQIPWGSIDLSVDDRIDS